MTNNLEIANLVLGIIGTITGSIAIFIHFWRLRRENPRLEVTVLKCEHDFRVSKSQIKIISFLTKFQIKNLGDRGTNINDIELTFEDDGEEYHLKKQYFRGYINESGRKWINAHETIDIETAFWTEFKGNEPEQVNCTFTIYQTHGSENAEIISQKENPTNLKP